jgi:putative DNA primase/helicase
MSGQLLDRHRDLLIAAAIDIDIAIAAGVHSVTDPSALPGGLDWLRSPAGTVPGLVFPVRAPDGATVDQYRPDRPIDVEGEPRKYVFPTGGVPGVNVHPHMDDLLKDDGTVVIVEGTKQYLAAVSNAPAGHLLLGISGCWGWSRDGAPGPELMGLHVEGRDVVLIFDADVASNPAVWDAASRLEGVLGDLGASAVRFIELNASGNVGLDDYLARVPEDRRRDVLTRMVASADKLPKRPRKTPSASPASPSNPAWFFNEGGLRLDALLDHVLDGARFALGRDGNAWTYRDGVYRHDPHELVRRTREALGERWRRQHLQNLEVVLTAHLAGEGMVLGDAPLGQLVNLRNGMLDPLTGELHPHDPDHMSFAQIPVEWNPDAVCPRFDRWLVERCGDQGDDLLEAVALMLIPWVGQRKVVFLFGPSRSGKGTFLRILEAIAGEHHTAAVTLHQLATNRFAAAGLYGQILNSAGDLSDHHVDDLSLFKMLTGDDLISAEHKFKDPFTFRNGALFIFSANTPPTVSETSRAYTNRVRPYLFPWTYEGAEDQRVEAELLQELPGILVALVAAVRRWRERGGYAPANPMVVDAFAQQSDVAALFTAQVVGADPGGFVAGKSLHDAYVEWARANGRHPIGRNKFLTRLDSVLGQRVRRDGRTGGTGWADVRLLPEAEWVDVDPCASFARFVTTSPHEKRSEGREGEEVTPHEGGIGTERAKRAQPDPDEIVKVVI